MSGRADPNDAVHRHAASVRWQRPDAAGTTAGHRTHTGTTPPAPDALSISAAPAFGGDLAHPDPEQLVALAAASCQLLAFLAVADKARIEVVAYRDDAEARMDPTDPPLRITSVVLRPHITVAAGPTEARVRRLVGVAHRECYVARSLTAPVEVEATIEVVQGEAR